MTETHYKIPGAPWIALLSDFYNGECAPILSSLRTQRPDIIAIAGDVIYGSRPEGDVSPIVIQQNVMLLLKGCLDIAPTFLSLGNHEWMLDGADLEEITSTGVVVMDNSWIEHNGLLLGGLSSAYVTDYRRFLSALPADVRASHRHPRKSLSGVEGVRAATDRIPEADWLKDFAAAPGYHILLSLHPEYYPLISENIDLILSGHAHGGQWRFYNSFKQEWFGLYTPGQGWCPKWTSGVVDGRMVISAGLSNTTWVSRIWNPVEIVYINL